jgi:DNA repair exonuclease SbcCD ATPase subunit
MVTTTAQNVFLSEEETMAVISKSNECIESECSIDEVDELLAVLKDTEKELEGRIEKIMNTIAHLQHINGKKERETDEVRAFVKDMLRVFNTDKPTFFPTGFSGDVGKGAQTAYDALPPKKWVNPDKA